MKKFPCVYMRGGTSKAVFFHKKDLPQNMDLWPEIFLKVMGTPDIKQIDGMGGTASSTSKIAVVSVSERENADVDYHFFQVDIDKPIVTDTFNCGNISSAVGPFAIDEGLVKAIEPVTVVRVFNVNTQKVIEEHVEVENGKAKVYGDVAINGVPGTGSGIKMFFEKPAGAVTGKLFPTGNRKDMIDVDGIGLLETTIFDCANTVVFIRAADVGLTGTELTELNNNKTIMERLEQIRGKAAEKLGFVKHWEAAADEAVNHPFIVFLSKAQSYTGMDRNLVTADSIDICCRALSVRRLHKAYPMTLAVATACAAKIPGTLASELAGITSESGIVRLGHASGRTDVDVRLSGEDIEMAGLLRTARRIMDGYVYIR
jgi:2-methylaconitate cis-trans-isomerase PrpF